MALPPPRIRSTPIVHDLWAKGIENVWIDSILYQKDSVPTGVRISQEFLDELTPTDAYIAELSVVGGDLKLPITASLSRTMLVGGSISTGTSSA